MSSISHNHKAFQDLYCQFYGLFGEASDTLKSAATPEQKQAEGEHAPLMAQQLPKEIQEILQEKSTLPQKYAKLFVHHAGLAVDAVDAGTMISISQNSASVQQIHDAFGAIAISASVMWMTSLGLTYKAIEAQRKRLYLDKILSAEEATKDMLEEAVKKSLLPGIFSMLSSIGTILILVPDPTFATKIVAASIFVGMNMYSAVKQFQAAAETSKMITLLKSIDIGLSDDIDAGQMISYHDFVQKIIQKNNSNPALIKTFLDIGEQLKNAHIDLTKTKLSATDWLALSEKALKFKRWTHIVNGVRSFFGGIVIGLAMGTGAVALLKATKAIGQALSIKLGLPAMMSSGLLTSTKFIQHFSTPSLFKRMVLDHKSLQLSGSITFSTAVLGSENIKNLETKIMKLAIQKIRETENMDLTKTLVIVKNIRTDDLAFKSHPELRDLIEELKRADKDANRIHLLKQIGEIMGSIPVITPREEKLGKLALEKASGLSKAEKTMTESVIKMLTENSLTGYPESVRKQVHALRERLFSPTQKMTSTHAWHVKDILLEIGNLVSSNRPAEGAAAGRSSSIESSQSISTPSPSPALERASESPTYHTDLVVLGPSRRGPSSEAPWPPVG
jgi:hypothetical protein